MLILHLEITETHEFLAGPFTREGGGGSCFQLTGIMHRKCPISEAFQNVSSQRICAPSW